MSLSHVLGFSDFLFKYSCKNSICNYNQFCEKCMKIKKRNIAYFVLLVIALSLLFYPTTQGSSDTKVYLNNRGGLLYPYALSTSPRLGIALNLSSGYNSIQVSAQSPG